MLVNYCKIAWRNFRNNKFMSFVNIFGLAVGLTCCMLIALYLNHQFSYDSYHKNIDQLYQVGTIFIGGGKEERTVSTPSPVGPAIQREFPEIKRTARLLPLFVDDKTLLQYTTGNSAVKSIYETKGALADSSYFDLFDYDFTEGNASLSLIEPYSVVLSEEIARKLFRNEPALNKIIHINSNTNGSNDYKVTGVFKPSLHPSHIDVRFFLSMSSGDFGKFTRENTDFANNNMFFTYVLLNKGTNPQTLQKKFPAFVDKYMKKDLAVAGYTKKQFLLAVKDIHLRSGIENAGRNVTQTGNLSYLYMLASIAVFILLIACINFMNLATARSAKRAAEVGIRKVLGAERKELVRQFLGESLLLSLLSFLLAWILLQLAIPVFSKVADIHLYFSFSEHTPLFLGFIGLTLFTGLIAGSYPALYLSAFRPIKVLKGRFANSFSAITLRKALVVFQFTISAALIIAAFIIGRQMNYMQTRDLGFAKDQQVVIPLRSENAKKIYPSLKNEIVRNRQVSAVGASLYYPGIANTADMLLYSPEKTVNDAVDIRMNWTDNSFLKTLEIQPLAGRLFSEEFPADTNYRMILNEAAIKKLGYQKADDAIGKQVVFDWQGTAYKYEIIGVVKDFNFEGLKEPINPFAFQMVSGGNFNYIIAHVKPGDLGGVLHSFETAWNRLNPNEPFEYSFLDQDFQKNYKAENRLAALIRYFMFIAIAICCLGLFGLAAFSAEQRTREIGIRKVLGSSVTGLVTLLSKDFIKLVLIGNILAIPIAWYIMYQWLQDFAFRTHLSWWIFGAAVVLSLLIAVLTVSYQAIRSALSNPVKALRSE